MEVAPAADAIEQSNAGSLEVKQGTQEEQGSGESDSDSEISETPEVLESIVCAGAGYIEEGSEGSFGGESWDDLDSGDSSDDEGSLYEDDSRDNAN